MNAKIDKNTTTVWIVSYRNFPNCLNKLPIIEQVYTESIALCKSESARFKDEMVDRLERIEQELTVIEGSQTL